MHKNTNTADDGTLLLKIEEAQAKLRCSRSKIYELGAEGKLTLVKLGRATRVVNASVTQYVAALIAEARSAA